MPIHIQYWTATVAEDGTVVFRTDVYGRDTALQAALALPAPDEPE
jgi:murein L,D-transpeptidase YcbB/YkuD